MAILAARGRHGEWLASEVRAGRQYLRTVDHAHGPISRWDIDDGIACSRGPSSPEEWPDSRVMPHALG